MQDCALARYSGSPNCPRTDRVSFTPGAGYASWLLPKESKRTAMRDLPLPFAVAICPSEPFPTNLTTTRCTVLVVRHTRLRQVWT